MPFDADDTIDTYKLRFEEYPALEVTVREPSIGQMIEITAMGSDAKNVSAEQVTAAFRVFADLLESWNVERRGKPVPATFEGVCSLGSAFVMKLLGALGQAVGGVDPHLPSASGTGPPSALEESIPMAPASPPS
jgi:hypothetical protein